MRRVMVPSAPLQNMGAVEPATSSRARLQHAQLLEAWQVGGCGCIARVMGGGEEQTHHPPGWSYRAAVYRAGATWRRGMCALHDV